MSFHADVNLSFEDYNVLWDALQNTQNQLVDRLKQLDIPHRLIEDELERIQRVRSKLEARFQH